MEERRAVHGRSGNGGSGRVAAQLDTGRAKEQIGEGRQAAREDANPAILGRTGGQNEVM